MIGFGEHQSLREVCWFKTGGAADWYYEATTLDGLISAAKQASAQEMSFRVLGEGSHSLMSDSGFPGLVIRNRTTTVFFMHDRSQVIVDAGTPLRQLVTQTVSAGYSGLEFLTQVPGTIGGAVYHNSSLWGHQIGEYVKGATVLFPDQEESVHHVDRNWFSFDWHTSKLKQLRQGKGAEHVQPVMLTITLQLSKMDHASCWKKLHDFHDLQKAYPFPTEASLQVFDQLALMPMEPSVTRGPALASYVLDKAAVRLLRCGDVYTYPANPNFIINSGLGLSHDAALLIAQIEERVEQQYQVKIKPLIEFVGFWGGA